MKSIIIAILEHGPNDEGRETWSAYVPDLPGCISCGDTREECETMIKEAITAHVQAICSLQDAPIDDEPETDEERAAVAEAREWLAQHGGKGIPHDEAMRRLGLE